MSLLGIAAGVAGLNTAGSLISGHQNYKNTKKLMAYQNQMNVENWKMENQYNSPGAQMARLREAGLNPSLIYSSGQPANTASSINSSNPATMAGNIDLSNIGTSAVSTYYNAKMQEKQFENMEYQNQLLQAQVKEKYFQNINQALQNARESAYLGHYKTLADIGVARAQAELQGFGLTNRLRAQQTNLNDVTLTQIAVEIDNLRRQGKAITEGVAQQWARISIDKALADSNISVNSEQKELLSRQVTNAIRSGNMQALEYELKTFERDVVQSKSSIHKHMNEPVDPWTFANDVIKSISMYLRGF